MTHNNIQISMNENYSKPPNKIMPQTKLMFAISMTFSHWIY